MTALYTPEHHCQYDSDQLVTRHSGCTWTSTAMGVDASTGGAKDPTPDEVHALVKPWEEVNPGTPGWALPDVDRAMSRMGVPFTNRSGEGWAASVAWLRAGHAVILQGDSDQFGDATCSGSYDGPHAILEHPNHRTVEAAVQWWIYDPICKAGRWERESVLQRYAVKFASSVNFGVFDNPVPPIEPDPVNPEPGTREGNVAIRYVPAITSGSVMHLVKGQALYAAPGGARVTVMQQSDDVPYIGLAGSVSGKAWRAVLATTKGVYADGQARRTVLYVPAAAGKVTPAEENEA